MDGRQEIIANSTVALTVSSAAELETLVRPLKRKRLFKPRYISVAVNEYKVLSRVFNFPKAPRDEIRRNIISEACDLLSLPAHQIEADFQIFHSDQETTRGVFICAPKELVKNYLQVMDHARLIPLRLTDSIFARIDSLISINRELRNEGGCLVDLSLDNTIYFAVIQEKGCVFFRKVHYETPQEAKRAIIQTLQGICSLSPEKKIGRLYLVGDFEEQDELVMKAQEMSDVMVQCEPFNPNKAMVSRNNMFNLNLLRDCTFHPMERSLLMMIQYLIIIFLLLQVFVLAWEFEKQMSVRKALRTSVRPADYEHALKLQEQLK